MTSTFVAAGVRANPAAFFSGLSGAVSRVAFTPNEDGTPTPDEAAAAKAAADKAAADKAAADKLAADKAEADRIAADAKKTAEELATEKAELLKETMKRKGENKTLADQLAAAQAELKKFEGIDVEAVKALVAEKANAEKTELEKKGEYDRLLKMAGEEHAKEKKALEDKIAELSQGHTGLMTTIEELTVGQSFATSSFIKDDLLLSPTKARQLYGSHFDIEGGKVVGYNKPRGAAERTKLVGANLEPLSFDEAFKKLIDADPDKESLIKFKGKPGSESRTETGKVTGERKKEEGGLYGSARILAGMKAELKA